MNGVVSRHWQTHVVLDEIELAGIVHDDLPELLRAQEGEPSFQRLATNLAVRDEAALEGRLMASMQTLADADERAWTKRISVEIQAWRRGYDLPATASPADYIAWCVLAATASTHAQSGGIAVADPRNGSAMVPMPGLPWGRPAVIAAKPGAHLAAPGWLTHYVIPVEQAQAVIVAVACSV